MKIKDLEFKKRNHCPSGTRAVISFDNGYSASVITGNWSYTDEEHPYEIAVMAKGAICYSTPITEDVVGYLTENAANEILEQISELPQNK